MMGEAYNYCLNDCCTDDASSMAYLAFINYNGYYYAVGACCHKEYNEILDKLIEKVA